MKRLFVGLTLLLMPFLAALAPLDGVHQLLGRIGVRPWMTQLLLAAVAVGLFLRCTQMRRRLLYPRRGLRLLALGILVHGIGLAASGGLFVAAAGRLETAQGWAEAPALASQVYPLPVLVLAQLLLVVGAFRALCNLVSPSEFAEDF